MKKFSSTEIRARLAEIDQLEAQHQARDFDGELKAAMIKGANVDDLENKQLEDERIARRLRVEKQALTEALPDVERAEVDQEIAKLTKGVSDHEKRFKGLIDAFVAWNEQAEPLRQALMEIESDRVMAFFKADALRRKFSLPDDVMRPFSRLISTRLNVLPGALPGFVRMGDAAAVSDEAKGYVVADYLRSHKTID